MKKETINFKENQERYMEGFEDRKGKREVL